MNIAMIGLVSESQGKADRADLPHSHVYGAGNWRKLGRVGGIG
jgi:hypothetical protein